jgi:hypothetical protein
MATLNLTPEEFADVALLFLADKAINPDKVVTGNEKFNKFMEKNAGQIKGKLLKYYLDADVERRKDYKFIKKVFKAGDTKSSMQQIRIGPTKVIKGMRKEKSKFKELINKITKKFLFKKEERLEQDEKELLVEILKLEEVDNG